MRKATLAAVHAHAAAQYPRESCGLIVAAGRRERYVPCRNTASGTEHFALAPEDYAAAEDAGRVLAVVHSHPDAPPLPSDADLAGCEASGLPWHIVSVTAEGAGELHSFAPTGWRAPLLGRMFFHRVLDCYTLVRDYYHRERGIELLDFEREDDWWHKGQDLYMQGFERAGFAPLARGEALQPGDVILMQVRSPVANHAGVYLGHTGLQEQPGLYPVPGAMLHHLYGRLSERVVYGGHWAECTRLQLRYRG